jgi:hypothetical protein
MYDPGLTVRIGAASVVSKVRDIEVSVSPPLSTDACQAGSQSPAVADVPVPRIVAHAAHPGCDGGVAISHEGSCLVAPTAIVRGLSASNMHCARRRRTGTIRCIGVDRHVRSFGH